MQYFGVYFSVLLIVSTTCLSRADSIEGLNIFSQNKQQSNKISGDPCALHKAEKPDFTAPGRRLATVKCFEYVWELKNRDDIDRREKECDEHRQSQNSNYDIVPQVVGGRNTEPAEFPHMGALGFRKLDGSWSFECGSSLISPKFTLTAAHCSIAPPSHTHLADPKPKIVRFGNKNLDNVSQVDIDLYDVEILQVIVHPRYKPPKKYNDIALVELAKPMLFTKFVQPACLWTQHDTSELGEEAYVTGWGATDPAGTKPSNELQAALVSIVDSEECERLLRPRLNRMVNWNGLQSHQICAGVRAGGVDTCQGDSGGPLQVKIPIPIKTEGTMSYVIGVTSLGIGCARAQTPAVYTRVSSFVDWIEDTVWRERN